MMLHFIVILNDGFLLGQYALELSTHLLKITELKEHKVLILRFVKPNYFLF